MDKAIELLEDYKFVNTSICEDTNTEPTQNKRIDAAIASLQAHKAKIDEIATDLQDISQYLKDEVHPRCEYDIYSRLEDLNGAVLQKLEELDK